MRRSPCHVCLELAVVASEGAPKIVEQPLSDLVDRVSGRVVPDGVAEREPNICSEVLA